MRFPKNPPTEYLHEHVALDILGPHLPTFRRCVRDAWAKWTDVRGFFQTPLDRTRANVISNAYYEAAKVAFDSVPGMRFKEDNERLLVIVDERIIVRFKLLDSEFLTRNYPTAASLAMDAQEQTEIEGCGHLPRVILGYRLAGTPVTLDSTWFAYLIGTSVEWKRQIDGAGSHMVPQPLPFQPLSPAAPSRFKWKDDDAEEGKEGSG